MPIVPRWIFALIGLLYFLAVGVDVMDVDAAQYAEISREMTASSNPLQVYDRGHDYLDKPPFLFWSSALSMKVFGATNFGYKLPSVLLAFLAIYATYRLTRIYYGDAAGRVAALILGSSQGFFLWTSDVRTDMALTGWVTAALWCIAEGSEGKRTWPWVIGGTAAIALGMMTKGPIALLVPLFAFGSHWVMRREWRKIFSFHHLLDMLLIALFLIPMCIGLYQQYDLQPEKVIDGHTGTSGLHFFFWTQSFGRITGENTWSNGAPPEFLLSSMTWAFLPWILLFLTALGLSLIRIVRQRFRIGAREEWVSTGGFLLTYVALASSRYQLPHYILVAFPFAAMATAAILKAFWEGRLQKLYRIAIPVHMGIAALLLLLVGPLILIVFPAGWVWIGAWILMLGGLAWLIFSKWLSHKILWVSLAAILCVNLFLSGHFYPSLLKYQVGTIAGRQMSTLPKAARVAAFHISDPLNSLHFYARRVVPNSQNVLPELVSGTYLLTDSAGLDTLRRLSCTMSTLDSSRYFKVSELTPEFLNPATRANATRAWYLMKVE